MQEHTLILHEWHLSPGFGEELQRTRRAQPQLTLLIESVVLSGCGGLIGLGVAYAIKWGLVKFTPVPASMPLWAVALALIVSTSTGAIFGIYPAWKAARLDPIVALRAE